jgi:hypothetical protein
MINSKNNKVLPIAALVARAFLPAASAFVPTFADRQQAAKRREESRRGTHESVLQIAVRYDRCGCTDSCLRHIAGSILPDSKPASVS